MLQICSGGKCYVYQKAVKTSQDDLIQKCNKEHDTNLGSDSWTGTAYSSDLCKFTCVLLGKNASEHFTNQDKICNENPLSVRNN